mmetsp:Transcript_3117/g.8597  ORF Transcript_3117/g.8597 Transcript_3117/m.8597 type:complete len:395 (+) Transcript_3117:1023-2207(+)
MHRGQCIVVLRTFLRERKATSLLSTVLGRVSVSGIGGGGAAGLTASVAATAAITAFAAASAAAAVASDAAFECQAASCLPRSSSSHATSCLPPRTLQVLKAAVVHGRIVWQVGRARTDHGIARERAAARQQLPSSALKHGDDVVHACTRLGRVPLGCTARETNRLDRQAAGGVAAEADAQIGACAGERLVDAAAWRGVQGGAASAAAAAAAGRRSLVRKPVQADDANRERWRLRRGPAARRQPGSRRLQNIQLQREALRTGGGRWYVVAGGAASHSARARARARTRARPLCGRHLCIAQLDERRRDVKRGGIALAAGVRRWCPPAVARVPARLQLLQRTSRRSGGRRDDGGRARQLSLRYALHQFAPYCEPSAICIRGAAQVATVEAHVAELVV